MSIKAGILGGTKSSNLAVWTMAGLGITIGLYSCRKFVEYCNRSEFVEYCNRSEFVEYCNRSDAAIDRLSDDILSDIVSRLVVDEASRTSILSRRWRHIWTINPKLIFTSRCTFDYSKHNHSDDVFGVRRRFFQAVNQCLQLYTGRNLKLFSLHCCFLSDLTCHLLQWMQTLAGLNVEQLFLVNSCKVGNVNSYTFSFKLIDGFSMLECLHLSTCRLETTFASQCNSLLTLTLYSIRLKVHQLSDILMSCPNLTTLSIQECPLIWQLRISGPNLKLKTLVISSTTYKVHELEISDINIVSITIDADYGVKLLLSSLPKLERLHLRTILRKYHFVDDPRQLPMLKYLLVKFKYQILELPSTFRVFGNVRVLRLMAIGSSHHLEANEEADLLIFAPVLVACPLLEEFYLRVGGRACEKERKGLWPVLRHKHLERMELSGFSGTQNELEFAKFIATSAQVLQTLVLKFYRIVIDEYHYYDDEKERYMKEIDTEVTRAYLKDKFLSENAKLEFVVF